MNRRTELLLYLERHFSAQIEALTRHLGVGQKTIAKDVEELNRNLAQSASIVFSQGKYRLWIFNRDDYFRTKNELLNSSFSFNDPHIRLGYIVGKLIKHRAPLLIEDLADFMSISRSTAVGDLTNLRERAAPYDIEIKGRQNAGIKLVASEFSLRIFILDHYFLEIYSGYPLDSELLEPLTEAVADFRLSLYTAEILQRWYTVMLDRLLTGYPLGELPELYEKVKDLPAYEFGVQVIAGIAKKLQLEVPDTEAIFLSLPVLGMRTPNDKTRLEKFDTAGEIHYLVKKILDAIEIEMGISITQTSIMQEFTYHLSFLINRLRFNVNLPDVPITDLQKEYPTASWMAKITAQVIEEELELQVQDNDLQLLTSYFQVFIEEYRSLTIPIYRIAVITQVGGIEAKLIQLQLAKIMSDSTEYVLLSLDEISSEDLDRFDLIITTTEASLITKSPIIRLASIFDKEELIGHLNWLRFDKKSSEFLGASKRSIIAGLLDAKHFFVLDSNASYTKNLEYMIDKLVELESVDTKFKENIFQREAKATMSMGEYVAFPHATLATDAKHENLQDIVLAIGIIPRTKNTKGLRLIVLLGVPEKSDYDDRILVDIYEELLKIAADSLILERISLMKTYEDFFIYMTTNPVATRGQ